MFGVCGEGGRRGGEGKGGGEVGRGMCNCGYKVFKTDYCSAVLMYQPNRTFQIARNYF